MAARRRSVPPRKTGTYGPLNGEAALGELARRQDGVFSLVQLVAFGLSASAVRKRAGTGRLHRVHRGVYSLAPTQLLSRNGHYMAAVLACGPGAALSHRSAADLQDLRADHRARIDVIVPGDRGGNRPGLDIHCSRTLTAADVTTVSGIRCTTIARTLLDLGAVVRRRQVERAFDQAEILERLDARAVDDQLARNPTSRGARPLREVIADRRAGGPSTLTESQLEERMLALSRASQLPPPEVNVWIVPDDGEPAMRVDFLWRAQRLVVETDGRSYHGSARAFEIDRRRDQRLTAAGWRVVRVTGRQLDSEPGVVERTIGALLGCRPGRRARA